MKIERRSIAPAAIQWRADPKAGTFEGYLSVFSVKDSYGTTMQPRCWSTFGLPADQVYPFLDMHDRTSVVRSVLGGFTATEDETGLLIVGTYADTPAGQAARSLAKLGFAPELSVGFIRHGSDPDDASALTSCELVEGSQIIKGMASTPGAELVAVRSNGTVEERAERRLSPPAAGSYEETMAALQRAAREWAATQYSITDADEWWVWIEATYADWCVVSVRHWATELHDYWRLDYTAGDDGPVVSNPQRVAIASTIVTATGADAMRQQRQRAAALLRLRS